ncbi:MAG TPA: hypothetical protein VFW11_23075 [Cyclobacteriaceae bacterium]|nr:hypothetical protein [Cyclobacteriaceae bacterium]
MKICRSVFILIFLGTTFCTFGQEAPKFVYCEILGTEKFLSTKVTITVDFGQKMKFFADNRMRDETGKPIVFNSMIDALNFMGKQGWEFAQAYAITISNQNVYHYLMKKPFDELDEEVKQEFLKTN